jgi:cardiolipin synthase
MKKIIISITLGILSLTHCASPQKSVSRLPAQAKEGDVQTADGENGKPEKNVPEVPLGDVTLSDLTFFKTPGDNAGDIKNGHATFINAIKGARESVVMEMFHLTDKEVIETLKGLENNVKATLILDHGNLDTCGEKPECVTVQLKDKANIKIVHSSKKFSITHSKTMIIDGKTAYITTINLTIAANKTRDYGLLTHDPQVIKQLQNLYLISDVDNAATDNDLPPTTPENHLIFAPTDQAQGKLVALVHSALTSPGDSLSGGAPTKKPRKKRPPRTPSSADSGNLGFVYATVESLKDEQLGNMFVEVAKAGVDVRIIVPMCVENSIKSYDYEPLMNYVKLSGGTLKAKMMPTEGTPELPYMHGKMIVLSNNTAFVGSENFTNNSLAKSRETGIIFKNAEIANDLKTTFLDDWNNRAVEPSICPKAEDSTSVKKSEEKPSK